MVVCNDPAPVGPLLKLTAGAALLGHPRQAQDDGVAIIMAYSEPTERLHSTGYWRLHKLHGLQEQTKRTRRCCLDERAISGISASCWPQELDTPAYYRVSLKVSRAAQGRPPLFAT